VLTRNGEGYPEQTAAESVHSQPRNMTTEIKTDHNDCLTCKHTKEFTPIANGKAQPLAERFL
jgi:hypothetical protein